MTARQTSPQRPATVVVGHPFAPIGRGEDARCVARALRAAQMAFAVRDVYGADRGRDAGLEAELAGCLTDHLSAGINVFVINGDEIEPVLDRLAGEMSPTALNVAYPQWELGRYPEVWARALERFDEVWAPSRFVEEGLRRAVRRPIVYVPLPVEVRLSAFYSRRHFAIPEQAFVFLTFCDVRSYLERKNPQAVVKAFERLCAADPAGAWALVLRINRPLGDGSEPAALARLRERLARSPNRDRMCVVDGLLRDDEVKCLVLAADCFISLHRSEGFGRGLAEAMSLGKPVIGTGYSGNKDFMREDTSCLVPYRLIPVEEGQYPHWQDQVWADPDVDQAAEWMRRVAQEGAWAKELARNAQREMRQRFAYRAAGLRYRAALEDLAARRQSRDG